MNESTDIATRTQRFNEAARAFTQPSPSRHAKLMPFKDGIVELRQKGGSLRLIRELLATVNVAVGTDTIARFIAEVNGEPAPQRTPRRTSRRSCRQTEFAPVANGARPEVNPPPASTPASPPSAIPAPIPTPVTNLPNDRPRIRGPRIADPRNL